jgi:hypothetical protein
MSAASLVLDGTWPLLTHDLDLRPPGVNPCKSWVFQRQSVAGTDAGEGEPGLDLGP